MRVARPVIPNLVISYSCDPKKNVSMRTRKRLNTMSHPSQTLFSLALHSYRLAKTGFRRKILRTKLRCAPMRYFDIGRTCTTNIVWVYMTKPSLESNGMPGKHPLPNRASQYSIGVRFDHCTPLTLHRKWTHC